MSGTRMGRRRWTPEEDETVRRHYPLHGPQWSGWDELLPGRSYSAIVSRAGRLGVALAPELRSLAISRGLVGRGGLWTPEEDALVAEHYPTRGPAWELWDELLPGRSRPAISRRAGMLGHTYNRAPRRKFTRAEKSRLLRLVLMASGAMGATPYDVAMELVELGKEWERQATA